MKVLLYLTILVMPYTGYSQVVSSKKEMGYTFKGYHLGMTLEEFRAATQQVAATAIQIDPKNPLKPKEVKVTLPVCSSDIEFVIDNSDPVGAVPPGVVICQSAVHGENKQSETVAGVQPVHIQYDFYQGKLFEIFFRFKVEYFPVILRAFQEKYGPFTTREDQPFQNGFGAKWTGAVVKWKNDLNEGILLREGPQNGPGQISDPLGYNGSTVQIADGNVVLQMMKSMPKKSSDF